jgi:ferredoxin-NADP reductase
MEEHIVKILETGIVTHDVRYFRVEKPVGYSFIPGQATEVSVNTPALKDERRPFTFTSLVTSPYLEFMIKRYPERKGVTDAIHRLGTGSELILHDVFGEITYKGQGVFIAGGAGVTPFISIFRDLWSKNQLTGNVLIFGNKTSSDIILQDELQRMLNGNFINVLSRENNPLYLTGYVDKSVLTRTVMSFDTKFYVCGPPPMMDSVVPLLENLGAKKESIIIEAM